MQIGGGAIHASQRRRLHSHALTLILTAAGALGQHAQKLTASTTNAPDATSGAIDHDAADGSGEERRGGGDGGSDSGRHGSSDGGAAHVSAQASRQRSAQRAEH